MSNTLKFGAGQWATKEGSTLAYNDENGNFKPLPFTFDRQSTATVVGKDGLIKTVGRNEPRVDFSNSSEGAMLLEPQRSNLIQQSNGFNSWTVTSNVTFDINSLQSPDAENTATKIIANSTNGLHQIRLVYGSVTGTYNFSVFAKKGEYKNILIWDDTVAEGIGVNLDDLSIFRNENVEGYKIEQYLDGWVRISYTRSYTSEQPRPSIYLYDNSETPQVSFSGNGSDGLYLWGAQLEQGSYATSYIPTNGVVTRLADDISLSFPDNASFNSSNGFSVISKFDKSEAGSGTSATFISFIDDSSSTYLGFGTTATNFRCRLNLNGVAYLNTQSNAPRTQNNSLFISCDANGWSQGANGVTNDTGNNDASIFNKLTSISYGASENYGVIKIKEILIYNTRLSNSELENLTTI